MTAPGWYHDPENAAQLRWWDGSGWSTRLQPAPSALVRVPVPQGSLPPTVEAVRRNERGVPTVALSAHAKSAHGRWTAGLSLAVSIIGTLSGAFVPVAGIGLGAIGLTLGIVARAGSGPEHGARGLAIAGITVGWCALMIALLGFIFWTVTYA